MMSNMRTMFDLNKIDGQGGRVDTVNQEPKKTAINAIEVRDLNFYYGAFQGLKKINLDQWTNYMKSHLDENCFFYFSWN